ncbi:PadR family transcriptional regulator [Geodermatophilus sp. TF02-6]|uniref:PadR family transcriptional regulator n=1 Tax=Geodermatophilus sp. TF02-6 TaxID=2250575 RepID=UPI0018F36D01|nr:PadR family transcriptional regulator [Geodermatophilus sp. TF02-6]
MHPFRDREGRHPGQRLHHPRHGRPGPVEGGPPHHRRGSRGRAPRGDVRAAVLLLLAEQPMHGYQLMQTIAERSGGRWTPSPGAIYPTISQLEDEGLVSVTADAGRKLVTLTDAGRQQVEVGRDSWADPFAGREGAGSEPDLRGLLMGLPGAVREISRTGTDAQRAAAADILNDTRRRLYLLLADGPQTPGA